MDTLFNPGVLQRFMKDVFVKLGIPEEDAEITANILIAADLRGIDSHGIARLPIYAKRLKLGIVNPKPKITVKRETPVSALVDADNGLGQVVTYQAMKLCIEKAKKNGMASIAIQHSNHFGIGAYYSLMAAEEGMIGITCTNASPLVAPFGGRSRMLGTNPVAITVPTGKYPSICLDMASTLVARGKLEIALRKGEKIPLTWAADSDGRPTDDPAQGMNGTLLPMGGPKGYGLALLVDIVSGILSASSYGNHTGALFENLDRPQNIGHFLSVMRVDLFEEADVFKERIDLMIEEIKGSEKAAGVKEIFMPGEIEYLNTQKRKQGIPLNEKVIHELMVLNKELLDGRYEEQELIITASAS